MAGQQNPSLQVQEHLRTILTKIVNGVHRVVNEHYRNVRTYYHEYLKLQTNPNTNFSGSNANKTSVSEESFNRADSEYRKFERNLQKIIKHVDNDYEYAAETGKELILRYQKLGNIEHNIENTKLLPESSERNVKLAKLYTKYRKTVDKYNKLALEFNQCISEFQALAINLKDNVIIIPSKTSNKIYTISSEKIDDWFKRISEPDEVSKLRDEIKMKLAANKPSVPEPPPLDTASLNLTPIATLTFPDEMKMETEP